MKYMYPYIYYCLYIFPRWALVDRINSVYVLMAYRLHYTSSGIYKLVSKNQTDIYTANNECNRAVKNHIFIIIIIIVIMIYAYVYVSMCVCDIFYF